MTAANRPKAPASADAPASRQPAHSTAAASRGRSYGGVSPEQRASARRQQLVQAGLQLFGSQGLRATTVRGVCRQAGLTDRYFYESFDTLEALLAACYDSLLDRLRQALALAAAPLAGAGAEARFTAGYSTWFDFVADPQVARVVLAEVLGVSPAMDTRYEAGMREFADALAGPLAEAGAGGVRGALIARALVGAVVQVAKMWAASGYRESRADVVGSCVLVAVGTVRALQQPSGEVCCGA